MAFVFDLPVRHPASNEFPLDSSIENHVALNWVLSEHVSWGCIKPVFASVKYFFDRGAVVCLLKLVNCIYTCDAVVQCVSFVFSPPSRVSTWTGAGRTQAEVQ